MVQLSDDLVVALSDEARRRGLSRSQLIREVLQEHLDAQSAQSLGKRIAEGYVRVPPATPDEWGDLSSLSDRSTADLLVRLDAEERAPW
jgi:hypothetical protein